MSKLLDTKLLDTHGRKVNYLRLSITDRCNLRCVYCHSNNKEIPHDDILTYEEMEQIIDIFVKLGVEKLRFTGGEPFLRKGFVSFMETIRAKHPKLIMRVTTNGVLLAPYIDVLKRLNVSLNVSLDTLDPRKFQEITGRDHFREAFTAITMLIAEEIPFKLNAVALKGFNDSELANFLLLATKHRIDLRFIEFMPIGEDTMWNEKHIWTSKEILEAAEKIVKLEKMPHNNSTDGPASMYKVIGGLGRFGFISPITNHYCDSCNRLRVTSEGVLRTCLYDDTEYSMRAILRDPSLNEEEKQSALLSLIESALQTKPIGAQLLDSKMKDRTPCNAVARRSMFSIGG